MEKVNMVNCLGSYWLKIIIQQYKRENREWKR